MANGTSYSASTMWEQYEAMQEEGPNAFANWLGEQFGYQGYYDDSGEWRHSDDFGAQYGMYLPTYDPSSDILAKQKEDITVRYAGEAEKLKQRKSKLSAEKEVLGLRDEYRKAADKSLSTLADMGVRSGKAEGMIERAETSARESSQQAGKDVLHDFIQAKHDRAEKVASADLTKRKAIHDNKQDWYSAMMRQMTHLAHKGAFEGEKPPEEPTFDSYMNECQEVSGWNDEGWQSCMNAWEAGTHLWAEATYTGSEEWLADQVDEIIPGAGEAYDLYEDIVCSGPLSFLNPDCW